MKLSVKQMMLIALFTALTAVGAFIKVPLPPVPITLQTLFVLMSALLLGSRAALISQLLYIFIGLIGIPVFAYGAGPGYILHPTFGYIAGFAISAFIVGKLTEKLSYSKYRIYKLFLCCILGMAIYYGTGVFHLWIISNIINNSPLSVSSILWKGVVIFIPGDILKSLAASMITTKINPHIRLIRN